MRDRLLLPLYEHLKFMKTEGGVAQFTETKKHSPNTGARANNTLQVARPPHWGAY